MFGSTSSWSKVAGLTITLAQTAYNIHIQIHDIIITRDNFHISIDKWVCHCSTIQVTPIVSTGKRNKLTVRLNTDGSPLPTCNCSEPAEDEYAVYISDIHFVGMFVKVSASKHTKATIETSDAMIKLENITVQNISEFEALRIESIIMIMQDVRVSCSNKIKIIRSSVTVHGKFLFDYNVGDINTVQLRTSVIFFRGEAKFVENKAKYGAALLAINSTIQFHQTAELVGNEGREGGAIALYDNSQLVVGKQSNVTFLNNHMVVLYQLTILP